MTDNDKVTTAEQTSSGVEALIERLRNQGVQSGRARAEAIVSEAQDQADSMLAEARSKAAQIVDDARRDAQRMMDAGEEALRIAARDTVLRFLEQLLQYLEDRVRRLVSEQMEDPQLLTRLILEVAGKARRETGIDGSPVEVLLPPEALGIEELKRQPDELTGELSRLAKSLAGATFREGVTFHASAPGMRGIRVRVVDRDLDLDLTPDTVADLLMQHLQPRFRALMQGIIQ
jgi:V/A-type H+/Na+-transporting ATPase subunit E